MKQEKNSEDNKILNNNSLYSEVLNALDESILIVNLNNEIIKYNQQLLNLFKIPQNDFDEMNYDTFLNFISSQSEHPDFFYESIKLLYKNPNRKLNGKLKLLNSKKITFKYKTISCSNNQTIKIWIFNELSDDTNHIKIQEKSNTELFNSNQSDIKTKPSEIKAKPIKEIVHDFNNILQGISSNIKYIQKFCVVDNESQNTLKLILSVLNKAKSLNSELYFLAENKSDKFSGSEIPSSLNNKPTKSSHSLSIFNNQKSILIMEDDLAISSIMTKILKRKGFKVKVVERGEDAISEYKKSYLNKCNYDLVIMDLHIKNGLGGAETIKELKKIDPKVNALLASGYNNNQIISNYKFYGFSDFLLKPFETNDFIKKITALL